MNDPHVVSLTYNAVSDDSTVFVDPPPVTVRNELFEIVLSDGVLVCSLQQHYPTVTAARQVVDHFLKQWEIEQALSRGSRDLSYVFTHARVIDRNASPGKLQLGFTGTATVGFAPNVVVTQRKYFTPTGRFVATPDVLTLWERYRGYVEGKEPLLSMAYFCLTVIEREGLGRAGAAKKYAIDLAVLRKLGELTSTAGDARTARKVPKSVPRPLIDIEIAWILKTIQKLMMQLGEVAGGGQPALVTMQDLPSLKG